MRQGNTNLKLKKLLRIGLFVFLGMLSLLQAGRNVNAVGVVVISNVRINDLTTSYADVGWNTDLPSDSLIEWGIVGSGLPNRVSSADLITTHQLRLEPLTPNTTYEYRVGSKLESESEDDRAWFPVSGSITFTTPAGGGEGSDEAPRLNNIQVNANCCRAGFVFSTSEPASYTLTITDGPNAVNNVSQSPTGSYLSDWSIRYPDDFLTPGGSPSTAPLIAASEYSYRIELRDAAGNYRSYGPLSFRTGNNEFDYIFTPGVCEEDGTPLGQCNDEGYYCGPGGLVINCEVCGFTCQVGETCRNGGACTADPGLGNDAFQCNPASCYGRACVNTGRACVADSDCPGSTCAEGTFLSPAGPGCYGSWNRCNANTVVQVDRDRVCNKWMTCRTQTQVTNPTTQTTENLCYDLAACSAIGPNGECAKPLFGKYCVGDVLRFCNDGTDCDSGLCKPASGTYCNVPNRPGPTEPYEYVPCDIDNGFTGNPTCLPFDGEGRCSEFQPDNVTYRAPSDVQKLRYLTGSVKAGLSWSSGVAFTYDGQFPWYFAPQEGSLVSLGNESFENRQSRTVTNSDGTQQTVIEYTASPWSPFGRRGSDSADTVITVVPEDGTGQSNPNHILKIDPTDAGRYCRGGGSDGNSCSVDADCIGGSCVDEFSGAQAPSTPFSTLNNAQYILNFRIRSSVPDEQTIQARLFTTSGSYSTLWSGTIDSSWQEITSQPLPAEGGSAWLQFVRIDGSTEAFYIDDVSLNVVLGVNRTSSGSRICAGGDRAGQLCTLDSECPDSVCEEQTSSIVNYIPRTCRLYPNEDSLLCEYRDDSGVRYKGWYGYCLERDPKFADRCISWWPVDIIGGETDVFGTFGSEISAGYQDRSPLYICVEAEGVTGKDVLVHGATVPNSEIEGNWRFLKSNIQGYESGEFSKCGGVDIVYYYAAQGLLGGCDDKDFFGDSDGDCEWSGCDGKADYSTFYFDARNQDPAHFNWHPDDVYYKNDIVQICLFEKYRSHSDWHIGTQCFSEDTNWKLRWQPASNLFDIEAVFSPSTGRLESFKIIGNDMTGEHGGFMASVAVQLREMCTKVVKVVDESGNNKAWSSRLSLGSGYTIRDLNYSIIQDLAPYGGAVTSSSNPSTWTSKLYVEQPRINESFTFPYQTRAGSPYACEGDCSSRVCIGGGTKDGLICRTADDCRDSTGTQGVCAGVGVCSISSKACSANRNSSGTCVDADGNPIDDAECCAADNEDDVCIGGAASNRGAQAYSIDDAYQCQVSGAWCHCNDPATCDDEILNPNGDVLCGTYASGDTCESIAPVGLTDSAFAISTIKRIFAESYGFWTWSSVQGKYVAQDINQNPSLGTNNWQPPSKECKVCNATPAYACTSSAQCGGASCDLRSSRGLYNPASVDADYCAVRPQSYNFSVNDQQSTDVTDGSWVNFKFNSTANAEQLPLNSLLIDWSDGQQQSVYFPYAPKSDSGNPHNLSHRYFCSPTTLESLPTCDSNAKTRTYPCAGPAGGGDKQYCVYQPRVVIKDNWGWCNSVPVDFQDNPNCPCGDGFTCHPQYNICIPDSFLGTSCAAGGSGDETLNFPPTWNDYTPNKTVEVRVQPIGT